jgi:hypothetical protein
MSESIVDINRELADLRMRQMLLERDPNFVWETYDRVQKLYLESLDSLKVGISTDYKHILTDINFLIKNTAVSSCGTMYIESCYHLAVTSSVKGFNVGRSPRKVFENSKKHIERYISHCLIDFGRLEFRLSWSDRK